MTENTERNSSPKQIGVEVGHAYRQGWMAGFGFAMSMVEDNNTGDSDE